MSRKSNNEYFSLKSSRNDRFAQMSRQEQVIEQKKREIQARLLQQKETVKSSTKSTNSNDAKTNKPIWKGKVPNKLVRSPNPTFNVFSNDGSFLDQFKQMNNKKGLNDNQIKSYSDENNKPSRWFKPRLQSGNIQLQDDSFSIECKKSNYIDTRSCNNQSFGSSKPMLNTYSQPVPTYSNNDMLNSFPIQPDPPIQQPQYQQMPHSYPLTGLNTQLNSPINTYPVATNTAVPVMLPPPLTIPGVPPPPIIPNNTVNTILTPPEILQNQQVTGGISVPPPNMTASVPQLNCGIELTTMPPSNPINPMQRVHTLPPTDINTLSVPPPNTLQLQNIPSPNPIRLNEIPNPKPIDLLNIPPPGSDPKTNKQLTDTDYIKNVPPPNKSSVTALLPTVNLTSLSRPPPPILTQPPTLVQANPVPTINFPPPLTLPINLNDSIAPGLDYNTVCPIGSASHDAMVSLGRMVAQCGSGIEDIVQQRSSQDPNMWFLFHKNSAAYRQYRQLVEQFRAEIDTSKQIGEKEQKIEKPEYKPEDIYEPESIIDDDNHNKSNIDSGLNDKNLEDEKNIRKRKRKSRWGDKVVNIELQPTSLPPPNSAASVILSKVTRNDPGLIQYAINTYGSTNLTEENWKKVEDHYKINLLYQDMVRKRNEVEKLKRAGKNKYEYDSDEEMDGGTWEHKLRTQEMEATQMWANELTRQAEGKHHIGDFLPPDELKKFMEKYSAAKEGRQPNLSDYKEFKLKEDNVGFKMLQKLGWQEGQGLGSQGTGIVEPVNKSSLRDQNQGLGLQQPDGVSTNDDEYDAYRKRMMLAYRFRPNPLNNPRRPYY